MIFNLILYSIFTDDSKENRKKIYFLHCCFFGKIQIKKNEPTVIKLNYHKMTRFN